MNKSDSERIAGHLEENGFKEASREKADLVILNTCGVRQSAEDRVYGLAPKIKKENPKAKIIIAGCLSEREDVKKKLKNRVDCWLPTREIPNIKIQNPNKFQISPASLRKARFDARRAGQAKSRIQNGDYLKMRPKYKSEFSAFVPIGNGCNNFCSYCVVPYARGKEVYRPVEDILDEVRGLAKKGYREIILIAQNVNSYKAQITKPKLQINPKSKIQNPKQCINFPDLLRMVNDIPGEFWIRFATSHPKDMSEKLIKAVAECSNPPTSRLRRARVCEHIHLPAQSGDNEVLKKMNRGYTVGEYLKLISRIRREFKTNIYESNKREWQLPVAITTDIIVGFPGETRKQFNNTVKLFKEVKFDMAYIAQYSPRPGTAAEKLKDDVPREEKKRREEELMEVLRKTALENNKRYVGKTVEVLIEGVNKKGEWQGKTRTSKMVKVRSQKSEGRSQKSEVRSKKNLVGEFIKAKINKAEDFGLSGVLI